MQSFRGTDYLIIVTGTITFDSGSYTDPNPDDTLGVGMDTEDIMNADYSTEMSISFGTASKGYTINNVPPGIYYIGGSVDFPPLGVYSDGADWLGSFGDTDIVNDPPNAPGD